MYGYHRWQQKQMELVQVTAASMEMDSSNANAFLEAFDLFIFFSPLIKIFCNEWAT